MLTRRRLLTGAAALSVAPWGLGAYAVGVEPMLAPVITSYRLTPPGWRPELRLRVTAIADIHACEPFMSAERVHAIALAAMATGPDLIVLLGDYNGGHRFVTGPVWPAAWAEALSVLRAPLGVYGILGNHDWWHGPLPTMPGGPEEVRAGLRQAGVRVLENEVVRLGKDGRSFWLGGLADQMAYRTFGHGSRGADDLAGTLGGVAGDDPLLMLIHEPYAFRRMPDRVSLTLCGHTHGGQVRIPGLGAPFTPSRRYVYGHVSEGGRHLIISGGLGESGAPVRFDMPPELVVVDLGGDAPPA